MSKQIEAMKLMLEALELSARTVDSFSAQKKTQEAITAGREALAEQPAQQEPVATLYGSLPVYDTTPQPPAQPLTDEQIDLLINGRGEDGDDDYVEPTGDGFGLTDEDLVRLVRRVEAAHGITSGEATTKGNT